MIGLISPQRKCHVPTWTIQLKCVLSGIEVILFVSLAYVVNTCVIDSLYFQYHKALYFIQYEK